MFQYTREFILNSNPIVGTGTLTAGATLVMPHIGKYESAKIEKCVKVAGAAGVKEVAKIAYTLDASNVQKFSLGIKLIGDVEASYATHLTWFRKPVEIEIPKNTSLANAVILINKSVLLGDTQLVVVTAGAGADAGKIIITASDIYQRFTYVTVATWADRSASFSYEGTWTVSATGTVTTAGSEGFGTAFQLLKNTHLPSYENVRYGAVNADETPVTGAIYDLYEIRYNSGVRNITGMSGVGETVTSVTNHRFWVISTASASFEADIAALGGFVVSAGDASLANNATTQLSAALYGAAVTATYAVTSGTSATVTTGGLVTAHTSTDGDTVITGTYVLNGITHTDTITITVA